MRNKFTPTQVFIGTFAICASVLLATTVGAAMVAW